MARARVLIAAWGVSIGWGLPALIGTVAEIKIKSAIQLAVSENADDSKRGLETLRTLRHLAYARAVAEAYSQERNPQRRERLANVYYVLTGHDISAAFPRD